MVDWQSQMEASRQLAARQTSEERLFSAKRWIGLGIFLLLVITITIIVILAKKRKT